MNRRLWLNFRYKNPKQYDFYRENLLMFLDFSPIDLVTLQ